MPSEGLAIIHSHDWRQSHICNEAVKAAPLSVFKDLSNFLFKPKHTRHDITVEAQYAQTPTSIAKKCTDKLFVLIAEQSGSSFPNLAACHDSMFIVSFNDSINRSTLEMSQSI